MDFARARDIMVESQVRTADVTDARILGAMRTLPRERFAPAQKRTASIAAESGRYSPLAASLV